jgi:hypothetical protein
MSDVSQGPGWWQASDGKWYPPELHPHYAPPPPPAAATQPPPSAPAAPNWGQPPSGPPPSGPESPTTPPATGAGRSLGSTKLLPGLVIGAGALLILGSLLPWATVSSRFGSISVDGTSGDGKITLILGVVALAMGVVLLQRKISTGWLVGTGVVFLAALGITIKDASDVSSVPNPVAELVGVHVGFGLWLGMIASIVGAVAIVLLFLERRTAKDPQPSASSMGPDLSSTGTAPTPQLSSPGPGWWQAADGRWYPPEAHPGASVPPASPPG